MNNTKLSTCLDLLIKQKKYVQKLEQEITDLKKELIVDKKKMSKSKAKKDTNKNIRIPGQEQKKKKKIEKK